MPDPSSLLDELKRRKVVRTALVYAVVAWMVVEVASVVLPALRLPEWTLTLVVVLALLGFPLVLTLEWVFEVTAEGVRRDETEGDEPGGAGGLLLRPAGMGVLVLFALGLGAWHFWPGTTGGGEGDAPLTQAAVAVLPFDIRGSADIAYLREGMVDLLSTKLEGTESLRPVDPRTILTFLSREGVDPTDPAVARSVSRRFGAGHYVQGSIVEFGGRLQVKASLYRLGDDEASAVVEAAVEGDAARLFELVDDLAVEILTRGGGGSVSRLTRLAALTTDSLSALKMYLEGESAYRAGRWDEAMGSYRRAVEIDSTFALAHYRLATAASWAERHEVVGEALRAATRHGERLSSHDRQLVQALAAYRRGEHAEAERLYREITSDYPDDVEAWYQLGEVLLHEGYLRGRDPAAAARAFRRAVDLDPDLYPALWHLSNFAAASGAWEELDSVTARILRLNPEDQYIRLQHVLYRGDPGERAAAMEAIERGEADMDPLTLAMGAVLAPGPAVAQRLAGLLANGGYGATWTALGHTRMAGVLLNRGRWDAARASLSRVEAIDPAYGLEMKAYLTLVAPPELSAGDLQTVRAELAAWDGSGHEPPGATPDFETPHAGLHGYLRLFLLGLVEARLGEAEAAIGRAEELETAGPPESLEEFVDDLAVTVRAEVARAEGDPERALGILEEAPVWTVHRLDERFSPLLAHNYPVFLRGDLLTEVGRGREALRWWVFWDLWSGDPLHTVTLLRRASVHEALGETEPAEHLYQRVREMWTDADVPLDSVAPRPR